MKQIKIGEREVNVINSWDDITIKQYFDIKNCDPNSDLYAYKIISIISDLDLGEIFNMYEKDLAPLTELFNQFSIDNFGKTEPNIFELNNITYGYKRSSDMTIGEYISVKNLVKSAVEDAQSENSFNLEAIQFKKILSILVRPAKLIEDEFGTSWELQKEIGSIETLQKREELVFNIKATDAIWMVDDFMYGRTR